MGWFKDFTKGIGSALFGDDAWFGGMGEHTVGGKSSTAFGGWLNDISGQTSSAKQQLHNQLRLQHDAQQFAKWQMQNAHQLEVKDLQDAGLNPILSANAGASAGVTEGSASTGQSHDPFSMLGAIVGMINSSKQTKAEVEKAESEAENIQTDTEQKRQTIQWTPELNKSLIRLQDAQAGKAKAEETESIAKKMAIQFNNKMAEMDVEKRSKEWDKELDIYKQQMKLTLMEKGVDMSTAGQAAKAIGKWVNAISPFTEFTGKSESTTPHYTITHNNF